MYQYKKKNRNSNVYSPRNFKAGFICWTHLVYRTKIFIYNIKLKALLLPIDVLTLFSIASYISTSKPTECRHIPDTNVQKPTEKKFSTGN